MSKAHQSLLVGLPWAFKRPAHIPALGQLMDCSWAGSGKARGQAQFQAH